MVCAISSQYSDEVDAKAVGPYWRDRFVTALQEYAVVRDDLFTTWLYTKGKPEVGPNGTAATARTATVQPKSYEKIAETHRLLAAAE